MTYTTLISPSELSSHLSNPNWAIVDCRFDLKDAGRGRREYTLAHIPGAVYAHLDEDLSGPVVRGLTGRHPLPTVDSAAQTFARLGIGADVQVVAYDDLGGALAAARLWWLLRWLGHDAAAVLDGGWQAWIADESRPAHEQGVEARPPRAFAPRERPEMVVTASQVDAARQDTAFRVLDARAADRYRGENETIDPVAGHIPGAISCPFAGNLNPSGAFRPADRLKARFERLLGGTPADQAIFYCGSGVTAAHNILAMAHAGLGLARLYAGSWSEWITDGRRPVAAGG
jgi:thiosulfate/3-mercaptopyruvate sulfurtransferase